MFSTLEFAIFRIMTMMSGDISYTEIFGYIYSTNRKQVLWIVFIIMAGVVIFVNVAFANLLVSNTIFIFIFIGISIEIKLVQ